MSFKMEIDGASMKDFNKVMTDYAIWNKRQPAEIVNAKLYFIALQAMRNTKKAEKPEIERLLRAPSKKKPNRSLAEILTFKKLKMSGKEYKSASAFAIEVEKFIKKAQAYTQFLRSGWLPTVRKLGEMHKKGDINFVKRYAPKRPEGIKQVGKAKGDVIPAMINQPKVKGTIINSVGDGNQQSKTVHPILVDGLTKGLKIEMASMLQYIERKMNEQIKKLNKK